MTCACKECLSCTYSGMDCYRCGSRGVKTPATAFWFNRSENEVICYCGPCADLLPTLWSPAPQVVPLEMLDVLMVMEEFKLP